MTQSIKVDVFSDVACPWCYVGKRKLEQGITEFETANPGAKVEVEYHSYQLNPDMPVDYEGGQAEYLAQIKGFPLEQVAVMNQRLGGIAKDVGLDYDFEAMQMTNTHLAHQLLQFAKTKGKQQQMKERIMSAHFVEGLHVGKVDELVQLAADVGLDPREVKTVLENGSFRAAVETDIAQAREFGIQGVPFFVIQNKYGMEGAQNPDRFVYAFNTVLAQQVANSEG
jgi:predicted DsbA family dithiol-disulfide isomerase